ncbi:MAG: PIN domain-containing protein [Verrucomicrobia bacterium]|nr:PIN domain-containing protein [Verrucomicrobiota bacterium]
MKVLFDANVVMDVLLKRPGFAQSALAIAKVTEPWLSTLSLANILYIVGRSKAGRIEGPLAYMRSKFHLAALTPSSIGTAAELGWEDFEDALQVALAQENGIPLLATRNLDHFRSSRLVEIVSVEEVVRRCGS